MDTKWIATIAAVVALVVGGGIGWAIGANTGGNHMMDNATTMDNNGMMDGVSETHHGMTAMDEKVFLATMIAHHEGAIEVADAELAAGKDPQVKAIARNVVATQRAEIAEMRSLYGGDVPQIDMDDIGSIGMMGWAAWTPRPFVTRAIPIRHSCA